MIRLRAIIMGIAALVTFVYAGSEELMGNSTTVRPPSVAGSFYPASPTELAKMLAGFFHDAPKPKIDGNPQAIIAPHAGYVYSGAIAAKAFKALQGEEYKTVIVISPSHTVYFKGISAYGGDAYSTPLGNIPIDKDLTQALVDDKAVAISDNGHGVSGGRAEHALEVQLPFLQTVLGKFQLVALVMGDQDYRYCEQLGNSIAKAIGKRKDVLIVASSDLSHFHSADSALVLDSDLKHRVETFNYKGLAEDLSKGKTEACGGGPIIAAMIACERLGATQATVTGFGSSGDVTGDKSNVVGYLSGVLYRPIESKIYEISEDSLAYNLDENRGFSASEPANRFSPDDRQMLLSIARESIKSYLEGKPYKLGQLPASLKVPSGAFVTLHEHGELRGCIGTFRETTPICQVISEMACQAAFNDYRFNPVAANEIDSLDIEISVLTPMNRIYDPKSVVVGRDGLYVIKGNRSGVLLPQVPIEQNWDRETFLAHTCLKAGLPSDSWRSPETELYVFQAEIFSER